MIKIEKDHTDFNCQVCGVRGNGIYNITLLNHNQQGAEIHLCKDCCKELRSLLKFTQLKEFKMVSIDDVDK